MVLKGETLLDIKRGDVLIANGNSLGSTGSSDIDYTITGSGKVVDYVHPLVFLYSNTYEEVLEFANRTLSAYSAPATAIAPFEEKLLIAGMRNAQYAEYITSDDNVDVLPLTKPIEYAIHWIWY